MGNSNNHPEYQTRVSNRLGQLPENVQQNLYADLRKASKDNVYDSPEWGGIAFHSADSRRNLPSYSLKREVILAQVDEQKLRTLGHTLMHSSSERSKEKAIKQVSRLSPIVKNAIYQELKEILNRKGVFKELSGKEAFYNSEVPNLIKGAAIIVYINTKLRQLQ